MSVFNCENNRANSWQLTAVQAVFASMHDEAVFCLSAKKAWVHE